MPDLHSPLPKPEPILRFPGSRRICGVRFGTLGDSHRTNLSQSGVFIEPPRLSSKHVLRDQF
ncbi:hypothetical protein PGTUg99_014883 [Puccinia graminis f. sp. tritici]|uniref:Uncharacterized protein n=1 Tax=Puccinia graminis f. sp. tritici TaxID=56615 RepID=A0A5B0SCE9_PUCGR|nr:hypothetical protein PGTUg99_014883 [Puccinia graminis f. sp. tritici]